MNAPVLGAEDRAIQLLRRWLSPRQRREFDRRRIFRVTGCNTGRRYYITQEGAWNVWCEDDGFRYCFVPEGAILPRADRALAQKIALETAEPETLRVANFLDRDKTPHWRNEAWNYG